MHNHDDKYPARPGFESGTSRLQAPVDTNEPSGAESHHITWNNQVSCPFFIMTFTTTTHRCIDIKHFIVSDYIIIQCRRTTFILRTLPLLM